MDQKLAIAILSERLRVYQAKSYEELEAQIGKIDKFETDAADGVTYQVEIEVMWDHKPGGDIRVIGAIEDGGWSAFKPSVDDFIMTPLGMVLGK